MRLPLCSYGEAFSNLVISEAKYPRNHVRDTNLLIMYLIFLIRPRSGCFCIQIESYCPSEMYLAPSAKYIYIYTYSFSIAVPQMTVMLFCKTVCLWCDEFVASFYVTIYLLGIYFIRCRIDTRNMNTTRGIEGLIFDTCLLSLYFLMTYEYGLQQWGITIMHIFSY